MITDKICHARSERLVVCIQSVKMGGTARSYIKNCSTFYKSLFKKEEKKSRVQANHHVLVARLTLARPERMQMIREERRNKLTQNFRRMR
ncbi:hypothetical protein SAMN02982927_01542 [Sporolactobacillus nakayamae]|uniref:Uncharacterized protein n=1 Tax=Sporolactobacillus nakayamae TaxID=269670 RepID=A0A1I2RK75_9BACL|nr:hypothetical protein SAMN02982927_01542 [Sporolactobacillus nakayamae]